MTEALTSAMEHFVFAQDFPMGCHFRKKSVLHVLVRHSGGNLVQEPVCVFQDCSGTRVRIGL